MRPLSRSDEIEAPRDHDSQSIGPAKGQPDELLAGLGKAVRGHGARRHRLGEPARRRVAVDIAGAHHDQARAIAVGVVSHPENRRAQVERAAGVRAQRGDRILASERAGGEARQVKDDVRQLGADQPKQRIGMQHVGLLPPKRAELGAVEHRRPRGKSLDGRRQICTGGQQLPNEVLADESVPSRDECSHEGAVAQESLRARSLAA